MEIKRLNKYSRTAARSWAGLLVLVCLLAVSGCGDEQVPFGPTEGSVHGVWEGMLNLANTDTTASTVQSSAIRLELVQRDFSFEGYLLKFDTFSLGLNEQAVDTFLVSIGSISANFVSFRVVDPAGGAAFFEGNLEGHRLGGSAIGSGYDGTWSVEFLF